MRDRRQIPCSQRFKSKLWQYPPLTREGIERALEMLTDQLPEINEHLIGKENMGTFRA
jgi:hypothetical protein